MTQYGYGPDAHEPGDAWLLSLVDTFERVAETDIGVGGCDVIGCEALRAHILARLAQPAAAYVRHQPLPPAGVRKLEMPSMKRCGLATHSPAICNRGWLPRSSPRSLAS